MVYFSIKLKVYKLRCTDRKLGSLFMKIMYLQVNVGCVTESKVPTSECSFFLVKVRYQQVNVAVFYCLVVERDHMKPKYVKTVPTRTCDNRIDRACDNCTKENM